MNRKNKWLLYATVFILLVISLVSTMLSSECRLSGADLAPIIVITLVSFLIKTGVLSAILIGLKKLWKWIRRK